MKTIYDFLFEKLHLNDKSNIVDTDADAKLRTIYTYYQSKDIEKMEGYRRKGSKPLTLVHTIKDNAKLLRRFGAAKKIGWTEALNVFGDALVNRGLYTKEEVEKYKQESRTA